MAQFPLIDGPALAEATGLIAAFGCKAGWEAAARADHHRSRGNVLGFCRWRQIARAITALRDEEVTGTVH